MSFLKRVVWYIFLIYFFIFVNLNTFVFAASSASFEINNVVIKLSLREGENTDRVVSIYAFKDGRFALTLEGPEGASLKESTFDLTHDETKNIVISFNARGEPGVRIGALIIERDSEVTKLPIIFEVESENILFDVNLDIPPQYKEIGVGEKVWALIKLFDLTSGGTTPGLGNKRVEVEYLIYALDGRLVSSQSENLVVDRQTQLTKIFSFPKDVSKGDYVLAIIVNYNSSIATATNLFTIKSSKKSLFFGDLEIDSTIIYLFIGFIIFFLVILFLFVYFIRDRDKIFLELRKYHALEMREMRKFLRAQQETLKKKRNISPHNLEKEIEQKITLLKNQQHKREKELSSLKKINDVAEMRRKLAEWKRKGYNTQILDYKLSGLNIIEMKRLLRKWRKKYNLEEYKK